MIWSANLFTVGELIYGRNIVIFNTMVGKTAFSEILRSAIFRSAKIRSAAISAPSPLLLFQNDNFIYHLYHNKTQELTPFPLIVLDNL